MTVIFLAILFYCIFLFITRFVIPVYKTTRQIRTQFEHMKQGYTASSANSHTPPQDAGRADEPSPKKEKPGEYIDFEEIKD